MDQWQIQEGSTGFLQNWRGLSKKLHSWRFYFYTHTNFRDNEFSVFLFDFEWWKVKSWYFCIVLCLVHFIVSKLLKNETLLEIWIIFKLYLNEDNGEKQKIRKCCMMDFLIFFLPFIVFLTRKNWIPCCIRRF